MIYRKVSYHLRNILVALLSALAIGYLIGAIAWTLVILFSVYLMWTLLHVYRLYQWLHEEKASPPPDAKGLWGDIFDGIYHLQHSHQMARDRQQAMINRIQESTNALKDGVIMTNHDGKMDWWNEAASQMLGFRKVVDRGQLIYNLLRTPEFKPYFLSKNYREPLNIASPINHSLQLQVQITLFGEEDRLIMVQNISRLVRLENMRKDFVSNVSHELRTPLTVITGYLETLHDHANELPSRWHRPITQMQLQSKRMAALVSDLLLLSRIENQGGTYDQQPIDVGELLVEVCEDARSMSAESQHNITLEVASNAGVTGNRTQLQSAFSNILLNAVKYTPAKGHIEVRWYSEGDRLNFSVKDSGIGFDPIHIPRLTERFYRADPSRAPGTGGTGLGLAIVKHVLINHDATLDISSQPGKGSFFICRFPTSKQQVLEKTAVKLSND